MILQTDKIQLKNKTVGGSWAYEDLTEQSIYKNYI
jgi:hypothetical protein